MSSAEAAIYDPAGDPAFAEPYIDIDEWKDDPVRYRYVHGGFNGTETRFSFFFPETEVYRNRFFQFMCPVPGNENAAMAGKCEKIVFAVKNGAYFVESNMGVVSSFGAMPDSAIIYRASAAVAEYSRKVAADLYGPHRPFGYIYGGSGGGYKTISCIENASAWDGAAPFVIGSAMSIPYSLTCASHFARILRNKLPQVIDATEPGGSGDPYRGLNDEEKDAMRELLRFGFPLRAFFSFKPGQDGSLPILAPAVKSMDPGYFDDFWNISGYLGADPRGSAVRDRLQHTSTVASLYIPENAKKQDWEDRTGVDDAWQRLHARSSEEKIVLRLVSMPGADVYTDGAELHILSGALEGRALPVERIAEGVIVLGGVFGADEFLDDLNFLKPGDSVMLDNSDYIAIQTYHRHQVPESGYSIFDQYRDGDGNPIYPQRSLIIGPMFAQGGAGSLQSGRILGKVIVVSALLDGNLPWHADWYRGLVSKHLHGEEENFFRLWYVDNAVHSDEQIPGDELHIAGYFGVLHQALLDLSDWVERGIPPKKSTGYRIDDGQVTIPPRAIDRGGIQPVVALSACGSEAAYIPKGGSVTLEASIEVPPGAGSITGIEWSLEGEADFPFMSDSVTDTDAGVIAGINHVYNQNGVFFPVVKVSINRGGDADDPFTQVKNLGRARIVAGE